MEQSEKIYLSHYLASYHGKTNSWGKRAALKSTAKYMRQRFEKTRCDSDGVGDCVRCQVMVMVKAIEDILETTDEDGTLRADLNRQPNKTYQ